MQTFISKIYNPRKREEVQIVVGRQFQSRQDIIVYDIPSKNEMRAKIFKTHMSELDGLSKTR